MWDKKNVKRGKFLFGSEVICSYGKGEIFELLFRQTTILSTYKQNQTYKV